MNTAVYVLYTVTRFISYSFIGVDSDYFVVVVSVVPAGAVILILLLLVALAVCCILYRRAANKGNTLNHRVSFEVQSV